MKKTDHLLGRYALFILGLFVAALGVAFSTKAGLGTSPVASVPYSVSLLSPIMSFGWWLNLWSVLQITVQVLVLKGKCDYVQIAIQTALAFVYGYLTDFSCGLISGITVQGYPMQLLMLAVSCLVLGLGIWIQFMGGVAMLPGEAMNRAIAQVTGKKYENVKILFDVLYIVAACVICLVFMGRLEGVREGSIIAALVIGNIIKLYSKVWRRITRKQI